MEEAESGAGATQEREEETGELGPGVEEAEGGAGATQQREAGELHAAGKDRERGGERERGKKKEGKGAADRWAPRPPQLHVSTCAA